MTSMYHTVPRRRWFYPTPDWLVFGLLAATCFLFLSERFRWFAFNERKGWTVLFAVAGLAAVLFLTLLWFVIALLFRRRFQYGIRSLLVLAVAVALPCSWLGTEMRKARQQREAVQTVTKFGGHAEVDYPAMWNRSGVQPPAIPSPRLPRATWLEKMLGEEFFARVHGVEMIIPNPSVSADIAPLANPEIADAFFAHLEALPDLVWLDIRFVKVGDAGMQHLSGLTNLRRLTLQWPQITDAGLQHLAGLTQLQTLDLWCEDATDAGLRHLSGLTELRELIIDCPKITDAGLKNLEGFAQLESLDIFSRQVTDAGLDRLKGLTQLQGLRLHGTRVTDAGVNKLQRALPKCRIELFLL